MNLDRGPYCFNDDCGPGLGEWVSGAKSFVLLIMDGEPDPNSGGPPCEGEA